LVDRTCRHAQAFSEKLTAAGYSVLNEVVLNQVLVSFGTDELTRAIVRRLQEEGTCWCGSTVWKGRTAMRISVSSWATTGEDVEKSASAMIRIAASCSEERKHTATQTSLSVRSFQPGDAPHFASLNEAWIREFFSLEEDDRRLLGDPEREILDKGGRILFATLGPEIVGTCALIPLEAGTYELGKMAVRKNEQGHGIGRKLLGRMLEEASAVGARRVILHTNSRLLNAIHLYESFGFRHIPGEQAQHGPYARADVAMELDLSGN
jgi:GNAT superfamily N-acetyltransferase